MSFSVEYSNQFLREAKRFFRQHRELEPTFRQVVGDLERDPYQPHLRLHALKGEKKGFHAVSLTYSYRIVLTLVITEHKIVLANIGTHDEVYRR